MGAAIPATAAAPPMHPMPTLLNAATETVATSTAVNPTMMDEGIAMVAPIIPVTPSVISLFPGAAVSG